jgi:hypothetical protein
MGTITIRDIPDELYEWLEEEAAHERVAHERVAHERVSVETYLRLMLVGLASQTRAAHTTDGQPPDEAR